MGIKYHFTLTLSLINTLGLSNSHGVVSAGVPNMEKTLSPTAAMPLLTEGANVAAAAATVVAGATTELAPVLEVDGNAGKGSSLFNASAMAE